eukprot:EG_transcript_25864
MALAEATAFWLFEVAAPVASAVLYAVYHIWTFCFLSRLKPGRLFATATHLMHEGFWALVLEEPDKRAMPAIQSLRNFQNSAAWFGTGCMTVSMASSGFALTKNVGPDRVKLLCICGCAFAAFFHYAQTVRMVMRLTFLFQSHRATLSLVMGLDRRAMVCYRVGNRLLYFMGPLAVWLIVPEAMLPVTALLIPYLWFLDFRDEQDTGDTELPPSLHSIH